jgi:DnaJ-class molecular chaperone
MVPADYYQVLGVKKNATQKQIKEAYRQLAFKHHPDRNKDNPAAIEDMKKVNEAYAVLSNPAKKSEYDTLETQFGSSAYTHFRNTYSERDIFSGSDIDHIFEEMANAFGLRGSREIFKEFYGRGYRQFEFKKPGFSARGFYRGGPGGGQRHHRGPQFPISGNLAKIARLFLQRIAGIQFPENGKNVHDKLYLTAEQALHGGPYAYYLRHKSKKLVIKIPAGIRDGQHIRLSAMGHAGKGGGRPGDLLLKVHIRKSLLKSIKDLFSKGKEAQ